MDVLQHHILYSIRNKLSDEFYLFDSILTNSNTQRNIDLSKIMCLNSRARIITAPKYFRSHRKLINWLICEREKENMTSSCTSTVEEKFLNEHFVITYSAEVRRMWRWHTYCVYRIITVICLLNTLCFRNVSSWMLKCEYQWNYSVVS